MRGWFPWNDAATRMRKSNHEDVTRVLTHKSFHIRQQTDQSYVHRMSLRLATPLRGILPRL